MGEAAAAAAAAAVVVVVVVVHSVRDLLLYNYTACSYLAPDDDNFRLPKVPLLLPAPPLPSFRGGDVRVCAVHARGVCLPWDWRLRERESEDKLGSLTHTEFALLRLS